MTKNIIIAVLIIIFAIAIYLYSVSQKQDATLDSISKAEVVNEAEQADKKLPEGNSILITKTSAGLVQPNASNDSVAINTEETFITFTGYKVGGEHVGSFETIQAELIVQDKSIKGGLITMDTSSVRTDTAAVDTHLQSTDFFDAEKYPTVTFLAYDIIFNDADQTANLKGSMTLRGVTQELSIPLTVLANGIAADFKISMKDFGIEYPATKDEVRIQAQIVLQ